MRRPNEREARTIDADGVRVGYQPAIPGDQRSQEHMVLEFHGQDGWTRILLRGPLCRQFDTHYREHVQTRLGN